MCYVLIGFNSIRNQDEYRVGELHKRGITPYVMCMDREDVCQKRFQKWVNGHAFKRVPWVEFRQITEAN